MQYVFKKLKTKRLTKHVNNSKKTENLIRRMTYIIISNQKNMYKTILDNMTKKTLIEIINYCKKSCKNKRDKLTNLVGISKFNNIRNIYNNLLDKLSWILENQTNKFVLFKCKLSYLLLKRVNI